MRETRGGQEAAEKPVAVSWNSPRDAGFRFPRKSGNSKASVDFPHLGSARYPQIRHSGPLFSDVVPSRAKPITSQGVANSRGGSSRTAPFSSVGACFYAALQQDL